MCVLGGGGKGVAMVLYSFNVLYLNSWEFQDGVTERRQGVGWPWVENPTTVGLVSDPLACSLALTGRGWGNAYGKGMTFSTCLSLLKLNRNKFNS